MIKVLVSLETASFTSQLNEILPKPASGASLAFPLVYKVKNSLLKSSTDLYLHSNDKR